MKFLKAPQYVDLKKFELNDTEWEALTAFQKILEVDNAFI
jgi:hypothetical protein